MAERSVRRKREKAGGGKVVNPCTLPKWLRYDAEADSGRERCDTAGNTTSHFKDRPSRAEFASSAAKGPALDAVIDEVLVAQVLGSARIRRGPECRMRQVSCNQALASCP